ncbi:MAG: potassium channel family protein [Haloarculaceae archaeon]
MTPFPVEILFGIYLGFLTGIVPALVAFVLGFLFKYFTNISIPAFGVVVLGVAIAGINGGLLALNDPTIIKSANAPMLLSGIVVVLMVTLYAHDKGDKLGARLPKRLTLQGLRERTLSADVVELVGGRGQVRVQVTGVVHDMEGYPPLPDEIRQAIRDHDWTLPADGPLESLEARFAERLRTEFDLADVQVDLDDRARATVTAAPPLSGLSRRVPAGERAVSVETLVPTGLARGDAVTVETDGREVEGTVVSVRSGDEGTASPPPAAEKTTGADEATDAPAPATARAPTASGGRGRLTVAVARADAETVLRASDPQVVVRARGTRREFELLSLLRRAGRRFRKLRIRTGGALDGTTLGEANVRDAYGVVVLAIRRPGGWVVAPRGTTTVAAGDEVFAVGTHDALEAFGEVAA